MAWRSRYEGNVAVIFQNAVFPVNLSGLPNDTFRNLTLRPSTSKHAEQCTTYIIGDGG